MSSLHHLDDIAMRKIVEFCGQEIKMTLRLVSKYCSGRIHVGQLICTLENGIDEKELKKRLDSQLNIDTVISLGDSLEILSRIVSDGRHAPKHLFLNPSHSGECYQSAQVLIREESLSQLETLSFNDWDSRDENAFKCVQFAGQYLKGLKSLRLGFHNLQPGQLTELFRLDAFPKLKNLDISVVCGDLSAVDISALNHLKLRHLSLRGCGTMDVHFNEMREGSLLSHLKSIHISEKDSLEESQIEAFFDALHGKVSHIFLSPFCSRETLSCLSGRLQLHAERWPLLKKVSLLTSYEMKDVACDEFGPFVQSNLEIDCGVLSSDHEPTEEDLPHYHRRHYSIFRHGLKRVDFTPKISLMQRLVDGWCTCLDYAMYGLVSSVFLGYVTLLTIPALFMAIIRMMKRK